MRFNTSLVKCDQSSKWKAVSDLVERRKLPHYHYENAQRELLTHMSFANPGDMIVLVGMTGTGKTKMAKTVNGDLLSNSDSNHVVSAYGLASNSGYQGKFDNKEMVRSLLRNMGHPAFSLEGDFEISNSMERRNGCFTSSQLIRALTSYVIHMGTLFVFIDEAQHLQYAGRNGSSIDPILNHWKAFAEETGTVLVLVASYQIIDVLKKSGHLIRRTRFVHLNRYRDSKNELIEFMKIISTYLSVMPGVSKGIDIRRWSDVLRCGTYGSIGLVAKWLGRAISYCEANCLDVMSTKVLEDAQYKKEDLLTLKAELEIGEEYFFGKKVLSFSDSSPVKAGKPSKRKPFEQKPKKYSTQEKSGKRGCNG